MKKLDLIKHLKENKFSKKIIDAFFKVSREKFIPKQFKEHTYQDIAIPIGYKQTISQPYTIAFMLTLLEVKNKQKILEIGSGSGYVLALLNELDPQGKIYGIERIKRLSDKSKKTLKNKNIQIINKDGSKGLPYNAPFDRILVSASCHKIPQPLINQLKTNGILVAPLKNSIVKIKMKLRNIPDLDLFLLLKDRILNLILLKFL